MRTVRFLEAREVGATLEIIAEAAAWMHQMGEDAWTIDDRFAAEQLQAAHLGELVGGFGPTGMECTMRLQPLDLLYWPKAERGDALYVHKLAVRRSAASQGWPAQLLAFASACARHRGIPELRLDTLDCQPLLDLYERLGFEACGRAPGPDGLVLMRMRLREAA